MSQIQKHSKSIARSTAARTRESCSLDFTLPVVLYTVKCPDSARPAPDTMARTKESARKAAEAPYKARKDAAKQAIKKAIKNKALAPKGSTFVVTTVTSTV